MTERQVERVLRDTYFVSPERRRLCIETAEASRRAKAELKPEDIRPAQGMYQFASTGGSSVFTAIVGAAMTMGMGLQQVFLLGTGFIAVGLVVAIFTFHFPKQEIEAERSVQQK